MNRDATKVRGLRTVQNTTLPTFSLSSSIPLKPIHSGNNLLQCTQSSYEQAVTTQGVRSAACRRAELEKFGLVICSLLHFLDSLLVILSCAPKTM